MEKEKETKLKKAIVILCGILLVIESWITIELCEQIKALRTELLIHQCLKYDKINSYSEFAGDPKFELPAWSPYAKVEIWY